jgi:hypothetical protein
VRFSLGVGFFAASFSASMALADPPGRGRGAVSHGAEHGPSITIANCSAKRSIIQDYFGAALKSGKCPRGLAKKEWWLSAIRTGEKVGRE